MIRFIDLTQQIFVNEEEPHFCFYDTVTDEFKSFKGECSWHTKQDFIDSYEGNELERYLKLIPEDFFQRNPNIRFSLVSEKQNFLLNGYQSPRGCRYEDKRPHSVIINIDSQMNKAELSKLIQYLSKEIYTSLGEPKEINWNEKRR